MSFDFPILIPSGWKSAKIAVPVEQSFPIFQVRRFNPEIGDTIVTVPVEDVNMLWMN